MYFELGFFVCLLFVCLLLLILILIRYKFVLIVSSRSFLVISLDCLHKWSGHLWTKKDLLFLSFVYLLYPFLTTLARTFSRCWIGVVRVPPFVIPDLKGKASSFSPLSLMLAVGLNWCSLSYWKSSSLFLVFWDISSLNHFSFST